MSSRSVARLAADRMVGRLGTRVLQHGMDTRRMAGQASPDAIAFDHLLPKVGFLVLRLRREARGEVPSRALRRLNPEILGVRDRLDSSRPTNVLKWSRNPKAYSITARKTRPSFRVSTRTVSTSRRNSCETRG